MKPVIYIKKSYFHVLCFFLCISPVFSQGVLDTKQVPPNGYEYIAYLPEGYDENMEEYPVLVYLHGGNGVREITDFDDFSEFKYGVPMLINRELNTSRTYWENTGLVVMVPWLPCNPSNGVCKGENNRLWDVDSLNRSILHFKAKYSSKVNEDRVYFSGISLGAKGVWDYAMAYPEVPAAIVPISGNAMPDELCNIKDIPVWAFHGDLDGQVRPDGINAQGRSGTYILIDVLNNCPDKKYTANLTKMLYKAHEGWDEVLDLSGGYDIYEWMLRHTRGVNNNVAPSILLNQSDQKYLWEGEPMTMRFSAEAFDSNGDPLTYAWSVDTDDLGAATFLTPQTEEDVFIRFDNPGAYTINIEANDGDVSSGKSIEVELVETLNDIAVVGLDLYKYDQSEGAFVFVHTLQNGEKIDTDLIGTSVLNIKAKLEFVNGISSSNSLVFSLGQNQAFRTIKAGVSNGITRFPDDSLFPQSYRRPLSDGEYIVTATPFNKKDPSEDPGISYNIVFYINEDPPAVLPVEFLGVAAQQQAGGEVVISWTTASEKNNDFFTIERSASSTDHFEPIGTEKGRGDSHTISQYEFIDHNPLSGTNFYRIKQTDIDGKVDYSTVTSVYILDHFKAMLYPNPASNGVAQLQLFTPDLYTQVKVQVMDALGNILHEENRSIQDLSAHEGGYVFNMKHKLKPGLYFVNVSQGGNIEQRKFIAQ